MPPGAFVARSGSKLGAPASNIVPIKVLGPPTAEQNHPGASGGSRQLGAAMSRRNVRFERGVTRLESNNVTSPALVAFFRLTLSGFNEYSANGKPGGAAV